jgi:hypothetical protein
MSDKSPVAKEGSTVIDTGDDDVSSDDNTDILSSL